MPDRSSQPAAQPTPPHRTPSRVLTPATPQACADEYQDGKTVRIVMDNQDAKKRSVRR